MGPDGARDLLGPHGRQLLTFFDELAMLPMTELPGLLMLARARDETALDLARRSVARLARAPERAPALREADELILRWANGLATEGGVRVPGYNTWSSMLEPGLRVEAASFARDVAGAILLGDLLTAEDRDVLIGAWEDFSAGN